MKKLGLLLFCFVLFLSGCNLTQNEKADRKEKYAIDGKKPKNLDDKLFDMGFRVEYVGRVGILNGGKRDRWDIVHINEAEQLAWKSTKEFGGMFMGAGEFMYRTYLHGDDPSMLFLGDGEDFENSIFGVGIKEGMGMWFKDFSKLENFKDLSNYNTLYQRAQWTQKTKEQVEALDKMKKIFSFTTDVIDFDKAHDMFSMKVMNIFNHAIMKQGENGLELFEWAFIEAPYESTKLLEFEADLIRYPMNSKDDSFIHGKDKKNPVRIVRHGERLEFLNGEKLPTYTDSPEINLKTNNSQKEGLKTKKKVQQLLYDIYQVLQGMPTAYYGNYAYHLVEDYMQNKVNFETNFYALRGMGEIERNELDAATKSFDLALKVKGNHIPSLLGKAKTHLMQEQTDEAMDIYKQLLKGKLDKTTAKELNIKKLAEFFVKNPNEYILIDILQTLYGLEKDKEIVELFEENAKQNTHAAVSFYYAQSLFRLGECEEASKYMEKAKSETTESIPDDIAKLYALSEITKVETEWKNKGCVKKETEPQEGDKQEWYITFEIDPKTKKVTLGIPEGGHVLNVKKGETIQLVEKNKDPNSYTKILFTHPNLEPILPKGKDKSKIEKSEEVAILAKEKGTGEISILPDGEWEKEHKIVVFID